MFSSLWNDLKWRFNQGSVLTRIIIFNTAFFVLVNVVRFILIPIDGIAPPPSYFPFIHFFAISSDWHFNLTHPWVLFTHMFLHEGFWHLFWNMILLYWFGIIVSDLLGAKKILPIYLLGGLAGGLMFFAVANISTPWSFGGYAIGASAAVMAIMLVAGTTAPDYVISLLFIGNVRLKYIVAVLVFLDLVALSWNASSGGSFGHIGGAVMGYVIASQLREGRDLTLPVNRWISALIAFYEKIRPSRGGLRMAYKNPDIDNQRRTKNGNNSSDITHQQNLDRILDKIKKLGYESLSDEEKEFLFKASKSE